MTPDAEPRNWVALRAIDRMETMLATGKWPSGLPISTSERMLIEGNLAKQRELVELRAEAAKPADSLDALRAALEQIRDTEGKVCENYELCHHAACQSSYGAWAIADAALRAEGSSKPPEPQPCGCTADTELAAAPVCAVCRHRDHPSSGCTVVVSGSSKPEVEKP